MTDPDLDKILADAAAGAANGTGQVYIPCEVTDILPLTYQFEAHPIGLALQLPLANGHLFRVPMDWATFQQFKKAVAAARFPGGGLIARTPEGKTDE